VEISKPSVWLILIAPAFALIGIFLLYKILTAKTRKSYFGYFGLAMAFGMVASTILVNSGLMPLPPPGHPPQQAPRDVLASLPWHVIVAGILWICGGNYILARQGRKAGLSWWEALNPFSPPFRYMNGGAWAKILLLAIVALGFAHWGIVQTARDAPPHSPSTVSQPGRN
jgi:hypothetical protein